MWQFLILPAAIARRDQTPQWSAAPLVNEPHNRLAVYGSRHRLPELRLAEPFLSLHDFCWRLLSRIA